MELYHATVNVLRMSALVVGSLVIFIGFIRAALEAPRIGGPGPPLARRVLPHVALGLEFFVGATILNLILNPTWAAVGTTILTIVTRQLITLSFDRLARER